MSESKSTLRLIWRIARPLVVLLVVFKAAGWLGREAPRVFLTHVDPWTTGVRQDNFGGGLDPVDLEPGLHFGVPGLRYVHAVDTRGHLSVFGEDLGRPGPQVTVKPSLRVRTAEDQTAQVDLALAWRIRPGEAHRVVDDALMGLLPTRVADRVGKVLEVQLASLNDEDWFDVDRRREIAAKVEPMIAAELDELHVEVRGLYLQGARFSQDYERKLQEKQVSHQKALLYDAQARVEQAQAEVGKLENQTAAAEKQLLVEWQHVREEQRAAYDLELAALQAETETYVKATKAEAEAAYQAALAEGKLAIDLAGTVGEQLRLAALDGPGGRIYLAREAAEHLKVDEVWLDSRDPEVPSMLDLDELAGLLFGAGQETIPEQLASVD